MYGGGDGYGVIPVMLNHITSPTQDGMVRVRSIAPPPPRHEAPPEITFWGADLSTHQTARNLDAGSVTKIELGCGGAAVGERRFQGVDVRRPNVKRGFCWVGRRAGRGWHFQRCLAIRALHRPDNHHTWTKTRRWGNGDDLVPQWAAPNAEVIKVSCAIEFGRFRGGTNAIRDHERVAELNASPFMK